MEHIGVMYFLPNMANPQNLINGLLYYDRLVYDNLDLTLVETSVPDPYSSLSRKLLFDSGLISDYSTDDFVEMHNKNMEKLVLNRIATFDEAFKSGTPERTQLAWPVFRQITIREHVNILNDNSPNQYSPYLLHDFVSHMIKAPKHESPVIKAVFNQFPSLEDIDLNKFLEFKSDPDTILKLRRLREWTNDLSKKDFSDKEIHQKLEHLLQEYTQQMEIHRLKYKLTKSQSLIVASLEFVESFPFLKFSRPAKALFELELNRFNLLDAEQKAVGREIAYIHKVQETFVK